MKSCLHSPVLATVLAKPKIVKELGGAFEADNALSLAQGECGEPDWDQTVLSIGKPEARVGSDFEEEAAVSASVNELVGERPAQGKPTEHKGTGVVSNYLLSIFTLLADHLDVLEFLDSLLGDTKLWED